MLKSLVLAVAASVGVLGLLCPPEAPEPSSPSAEPAPLQIEILEPLVLPAETYEAPFCPGPIRVWTPEDVAAPASAPLLITAISQAETRVQAGACVLHGRIVDDKGNPVAGAKVKLWSGMATRFAGQHCVTDADGRYRFDPLETGHGMQGRLAPGMQVEHPDLVSADGEDWWDVDVPFGQTVVKDFTLVRGGRIEGSLTFGGGQWALREFPLSISSVDQKRRAYATTGGGPAEFTSPALFPGEYVVAWNSAYPEAGEIIRVKVEAGKTTTFKANCRFEFKPEITAAPAAK